MFKLIYTTMFNERGEQECKGIKTKRMMNV